MYLWSANRLADAFKDGRVTERHQLVYLLIFVLLSDLAADRYLNYTDDIFLPNLFDAILSFMSILVTTFGTIACYQTSRQNSEKHGFLARYICISIPVFIQLVVITFFAFIALLAANEFVIGVPGVANYLGNNETALADVIGIVAIEIGYFVYLHAAIRRSYDRSSAPGQRRRPATKSWRCLQNRYCRCLAWGQRE